MNSTIWVVTSIIVILSILPFIRNQHWVFRVRDFVRPQLLFLQLLTLIAAIVWWKDVSYPILILFALLICKAYNCYIVIRFTIFWRSYKYEVSAEHSKNVKIISVNVYQF